jgi:S-ribosylhomocysteine lyase
LVAAPPGVGKGCLSACANEAGGYASEAGADAIFEGSLDSEGVLPIILGMLDWIAAFSGPIPGASPAECGNCSEQNLGMAQWEARRYAETPAKIG